MITIKIENRNQQIVGLHISGHAGFAEYGKDLVCAGVSSIAVGLLNAIDIVANDTCTLSMSHGDVSIKVNTITTENQLVLQTGVIQLETIESQNKEFIRIKKMEV